MKNVKGIIHSFQSMGAVDGPGLRYVIFMQGCPLRCIYCHNPDTWRIEGDGISVDDICEKVARYKSYFADRGGVTVSGGEPLLQWEFVSELFYRLQQEGIHTALDTSGIGNIDGVKEILKYTNLVICDLKFANHTEYQQNCKADMEEVLAFLRLTESMKIPLWIRHVVVPDLTASKTNVLKIAELARQFSNLQKLELLPFKKLCIPKYEALGIDFPLKNYSECSDSLMNELNTVINAFDK